MIIFLNFLLLTFMITLKVIFFYDTPITPEINAIITVLGVFLTVVIFLRFFSFCWRNEIHLSEIVQVSIVILQKKDDVHVHLKRFWEIGLVMLIAIAVFNRKSAPFITHFFLDALVLFGFLIYLYTLQYWVINLQAKLIKRSVQS